MVNDEPVQIIDPNLTLPLLLRDLTGLPEAEREEEARRLGREEAQRPFDLTLAPLLRATLLRLAEDDHVLLLNTHHSASDGWSLTLFSQELASLYEAFAANLPSPLAKLPVQYADFAVWQREFLAGEILDKQLAFWKEQLAGAPASLDLPTDHPRPPMQTYRGSRQSVVLPKSLLDALLALSRKEGVTLFMTLLAAFDVLLSRYSGQQDVVVGTPIAGRNRAEVEKLIGFFANTLVMRTNLSGDPTFRELLTRVRETAMGAYAHQDVPFEKLVEELKPERDLTRNPLFQVMFILQNLPTASQKLGEIDATPFGAGLPNAKLDIMLIASNLQRACEYRLFIALTCSMRRRSNACYVILKCCWKVWSKIRRRTFHKWHFLARKNITSCSSPGMIPGWIIPATSVCPSCWKQRRGSGGDDRG